MFRKWSWLIAVLIVAAITLLLVLLARSGKTVSSGRPILCAGISPIAEIVRQIAGDKFEVISILPEGKNPHDYSPGPAQMCALGSAELFFCSGLPFEERLESAVRPDRCVEVGAGIQLRQLESPHDHDDEAEHHHHHGSGDPHLWLSPDNLIKISANIAAALIAKYPYQAETFTANLTNYHQKVARLKAEISALGDRMKDKHFYVYHPAFGYYTDTVGMKQKAIEAGGREPSPTQLAKMVKEMRDAQAKILFVQSNFSPGSAETLRRQTGAKIIEVDPLTPDTISLLRQITAELNQNE